MRPAAFKKCPCCKAIWKSQDAFLSDAKISYCGYQANLVDLDTGLFLFNHACGTTLALPVKDFRQLYDGPVYQERRIGDEECPGYCLHKEETRICPRECACAYVREVMQVILQWPKNNTIA